LQGTLEGVEVSPVIQAVSPMSEMATEHHVVDNLDSAGDEDDELLVI